MAQVCEESELSVDAKSGKKKKEKEDSGPVTLSGVYVFPNGDKYEGEYQKLSDGVLSRCGMGEHTTREGLHYSGSWADDKMNGKGSLVFPSGAKYEGDFVNNKFHGSGRYTWPNGSFYEGQFVENKLEGENGEFRDTEGQTWTGTFRYKAALGLRFKLNL